MLPSGRIELAQGKKSVDRTGGWDSLWPIDGSKRRVVKQSCKKMPEEQPNAIKTAFQVLVGLLSESKNPNSYTESTSARCTLNAALLAGGDIKSFASWFAGGSACVEVVI